MASEKLSFCVGVRIRPLIERESKLGTGSNWLPGKDVIQQIDPETGHFVSQSTPYKFDHVFDGATRTSQIYEAMVAPVVRDALNGFNGTILCYGQTSSGKTFTLFGKDSEEGIISLAAQDIFKHISEDELRTYIIRVSLVEIYNEKVTDMLNPGKPIEIHEVNGVITPKDLQEIEVLKPEDLLKSAKRVQQLRKTSETNMNKESSRSHTILRIAIESVPKREYPDGDNDVDEIHVTNALLNFVDLAGSEKFGQGDRLKETTSINSSLSVLSQVVMQLSEDSRNGNRGQSGIPTAKLTASTSKPKQKFASFRDSKLTRILQSSLSGNAYVVMICNVTPAQSSIDETYSTLRFAKTAKKIKIKPKANHVLPVSAKYQQKIKDLLTLLGGKSSEVDELKRQLGIYMNFCHNDRSLSSSAQTNPQSESKPRRKTCCPSQLKLMREASRISPVVNSDMDSSDLYFTPPSTSSSRVLKPHNRTSFFSPVKQEFNESLMTHNEALKHFPLIPVERGKPIWSEDGLPTSEELELSRSRSPRPESPLAKKPRQENQTSYGRDGTPGVSLRRRLIMDDTVEQQTEQDSLLAIQAIRIKELETRLEEMEDALTEKTSRVVEIEAILDDLDLSGIRSLGEKLKIALTIEKEDVETSTEGLLPVYRHTSPMDSYITLESNDATTSTKNLVNLADVQSQRATTEIQTNDAMTNTESIVKFDAQTSTALVRTNNAGTCAEHFVNLLDAQTTTEVKTPGHAVDFLDAQSQRTEIGVNSRGVQTVDDGIKAHVRNLQIMVKVREKDLSDLQETFKTEAVSMRKLLAESESKLISTCSQIGSLRTRNNSLESQFLGGIKRKIDSEIQCDYIIEQANRAITGEIGLLPHGFPDIGVLARNVKRLKQTNFILDIENKNCTCKGISKAINILTKVPQQGNKFLIPESLGASSYPSVNKFFPRAKQNSSSLLSSEPRTRDTRFHTGPSSSSHQMQSSELVRPIISLDPVQVSGPVPTETNLLSEQPTELITQTDVSSEDEMSWLDEIGSDTYLEIWEKGE